MTDEAVRAVFSQHGNLTSAIFQYKRINTANADILDAHDLLTEKYGASMARAYFLGQDVPTDREALRQQAGLQFGVDEAFRNLYYGLCDHGMNSDEAEIKAQELFHSSTEDAEKLFEKHRANVAPVIAEGFFTALDATAEQRADLIKAIVDARLLQHEENQFVAGDIHLLSKADFDKARDGIDDRKAAAGQTVSAGYIAIQDTLGTLGLPDELRKFARGKIATAVSMEASKIVDEMEPKTPSKAEQVRGGSPARTASAIANGDLPVEGAVRGA